MISHLVIVQPNDVLQFMINDMQCLEIIAIIILILMMSAILFGPYYPQHVFIYVQLDIVVDYGRFN